MKTPQLNIRYSTTVQPNPLGTDETYYIFEVYRRKWIFGKRRWYHSATTNNYELGLEISEKMLNR